MMLQLKFLLLNQLNCDYNFSNKQININESMDKTSR